MPTIRTIPDRLNLSATLKVRAAKDSDGKKLAKLRLFAYGGRPMRLSGFFDPVVIDLAGARFDKDKTPVIVEHDTGKRVGHTVTQKINRNGIFAEAVVSSSMAIAAGIVADLQNGFPFQVSVGAEIRKGHFLEPGETAEVNANTVEGPLIVATEVVIKELSLAVLAADNQTSAEMAASYPKGTTMPQPLDIHAVSDSDLQLRRQRIAAEEARVDAIRAIADRYGSRLTGEFQTEDGKKTTLAALKATAVSEGWDQNRFELQLLRASREVDAPSGGLPPHLPSNPVEVIQGILLCRAGYESAAEKALGPHILEAANRLRSISFPEIARMALMADGQPVPFGRDDIIRAAFSTNAMTNALGGAMDKLLHITFQEAGTTWQSFAMIKPLANFRQHTIISPQHRGQLTELGKDGELKHGTLDEDTTSLQIATYAKLVGVSRQDVVNDDLSIFDEVARVLAVQAARKLNDLVYETIMANAGSFFSASRGNLLTGSTSALSSTSLANAVTAMRKQRDADNNDLDIRPAVLCVPPELEVTAREILQSIEVNKTGDNTPVGNALKDIATLEVEPRLSTTTKFTNASTTAWYLFSSPQNAPVYVGTLNGQLAPVVETFGLDSDPRRLVFQWRVYGDWGAALGEYRAAAKSDGA